MDDKRLHVKAKKLSLALIVTLLLACKNVVTYIHIYIIIYNYN